MPRSLVAIGSNLGDRAATLDGAVAALAQSRDVRLLRQSAWQMTLPVGGRSGRSEFLNGAALFETSLSPQELLMLLQQIENQFGRERQEHWGDRTLDLDLLLHDDAVINSTALTLPHPRMSFRRFVLEPAVEIAPEMIHPTIGWTLERLLERLDDGADCLAIVADDETARDALVVELTSRFGFERRDAPSDDGVRWPLEATTWLALPDADSSRAEPKLTIVFGAERQPVPGRGPTLQVPAADGMPVGDDVFAAVEAVWPHLGPSAGERLQ
ncbi:MAG: 2-amino-4-hydroxy-6-hydroxymethyldihydropteridine diphosphokinase [Pirellulales bacterium]